jgi:hypothetical protein
MWLVMGNRGGTSSGAFDEVFCSGAIRVVTTPPAGAAGDAIVERFVRTVRAECLDWLLFGLLPRRCCQLRPGGVCVAEVNSQVCATSGGVR